MDLENVEYIGVKRFFDDVQSTGELWVARSVYKNIYALELDKTGYSLPVWSSKEKADEFLRKARPIGPPYESHAVSMERFTKAWLSDTMMAITEVQINPDGRGTRVLCLTAEEFKASQA